LILGLGAALLGAWFGTRHARVLTPHEPAYDTHTTTVVTHAPYEPPVTHTAYVPPVTHTVYEPPAAAASVHVYDETGRAVPSYLRDISFPATKQDLLRAVRANNVEPMALRKLEQVADRNYSSLPDLMAALAAA